MAAGSIEFEAQFFPCAHLKNVSFTEPVTGTISEEEETIAEIESSVGSSIHPNASVTSVKTTDRPSTAGSASTTSSKKEVKVDPNEGIVVPRAELLTTRTSPSLSQ
jgi:ethanolamine utilization protein EutQ (cupin superfamily)